VIVVDDDDGVREALHLILDDDYEGADAADGGKAVDTVRTRPVDLALLDILLPDIDGIEALKELKAMVPAIPVIMLTGVRTVRTTVAAMKLGAVDYVTKPFQEDELLGLIHGAIAPRRPAAGRILIVDGDHGRRAALAVLLERLAADVSTAAGANDLDETGEAPSLCVVLGLGRGRSGLTQTARSVRARFPACPIVARLERDDLDTVHELEALKPCVVLPPTDELADVVHRVCVVSGAPQLAPTGFSNSVNRAITWIGAKHAEKLTVEGIAEAVDISTSHLAHAFRVETGMTVMDFVTKVRVEIAKRLLATTDHNLAEIAARSGFFDASHLSRMFLHTTGRRPGFYRRQSR
jgi:DNA-binding response OmpR family regulator/AraC-like DNA-binding protein